MRGYDSGGSGEGVLYRFSVIYNEIEVSSWTERLPDDEAADALLDLEDERVAAELEEAAQEYGLRSVRSSPSGFLRTGGIARRAG